MKRINIGVVGYGFGAMFARFLLTHPAVGRVVVCETDAKKLDAAKAAGLTEFRHDYHDILADDAIDAVCLELPLDSHVNTAADALLWGKHCACAVPMGFTAGDLSRIIAAEKKSGKHYMMLETALYSRSFLYAKQLLADGVPGRIQYLRSIHSQAMDNRPGSWQGLPPMWDCTHAAAPMLSLLGLPRIKSVSCIGSGTMSKTLSDVYGNPFPIETMRLTFDETPVVVEIQRTMFETAPMGGEYFELYGSRASYFSQTQKLVTLTQEPGENGIGFRTIEKAVEPPVRWDLLPAEFKSVCPNPTGYEEPVMHLVHEFVSSILENRKPAMDSITAANLTLLGFAAHDSAMNNGEIHEVPAFPAE